MGDFLKFKEQFRGIAGTQQLALFFYKVNVHVSRFILAPRYVVASLDATVWPANSNYLNDAISNLATVLALSPTHVGLVQYPVYQSQTNSITVVKHRHAVDLLLLKANLTAHNLVQMTYEKPESSARDGRCLSQLAVAVFHQNFETSAFKESTGVREGKLGPLPLIRVADMIGFDETRRPGASARAEQQLGLFLGVLNFVLLNISDCFKHVGLAVFQRGKGCHAMISWWMDCWRA